MYLFVKKKTGTVIIYTADKVLGFTPPAHLSPRYWCVGSSKKETSMSMGLNSVYGYIAAAISLSL